MIRAARVKWIKDQYPLITLLVEKFDWTDTTWKRYEDNYTTIKGNLIFSYYRQKGEVVDIQSEKKFELSDGTVEVLTNPCMGFPYLDRFPEELVAVQYTFDTQLMRDGVGKPCYVKAYWLNEYLREMIYDFRVGLVLNAETEMGRIEPVRVLTDKQNVLYHTNDYTTAHSVEKVFGEWND